MCEQQFDFVPAHAARISKALLHWGGTWHALSLFPALSISPFCPSLSLVLPCSHKHTYNMSTHIQYVCPHRNGAVHRPCSVECFFPQMHLKCFAHTHTTIRTQQINEKFKSIEKVLIFKGRLFCWGIPVHNMLNPSSGTRLCVQPLSFPSLVPSLCPYTLPVPLRCPLWIKRQKKPLNMH